MYAAIPMIYATAIAHVVSNSLFITIETRPNTQIFANAGDYYVPLGSKVTISCGNGDEIWLMPAKMSRRTAVDRIHTRKRDDVRMLTIDGFTANSNGLYYCKSAASGATSGVVNVDVMMNYLEWIEWNRESSVESRIKPVVTTIAPAVIVPIAGKGSNVRNRWSKKIANRIEPSSNDDSSSDYVNVTLIVLLFVIPASIFPIVVLIYRINYCCKLY